MRMRMLTFAFWMVMAMLAGGGCTSSPAPGGEGAGTDSAQVTSSAILPDTIRKQEVAEIPPDTVAPEPNTMNDSRLDAKTQTLKGEYVDIQEGDYLHFVMKDEQGNRRSFFLSDDMPQDEWMPFYDGDHDPGTKIEVEWREVTRFLKAAGAENTIEEITSIRKL